MKKLNKKFLALTLSFVMMALLAMPAMALADLPETIGVVDVKVAIPLIGDTVADNQVVTLKPASQLVDTYFVEWYSRQVGTTDDYAPMEDSDTFEAGYEYEIAVTVSPAEGYQFEQGTPEEPKSWGRVNNTIVDASIVKDANEASISAELGEANIKIEKIEYTVPKPVAGQNTLDIFASIVCDPEGGIDYEASKVISWNKRLAGSTDDYQYMGDNVIFDEGDYEYKVLLGARAADGYGFPDDTEIYVNGQKVEGAEYYDDINSLIFKVELDEKNYPDASTDDETTAAEETTATDITTAAGETTATNASTVAAETAANTVKAGDSSNVMLFVLLAIAAVAAGTVTLFATKKNK